MLVNCIPTMLTLPAAGEGGTGGHKHGSNMLQEVEGNAPVS